MENWYLYSLFALIGWGIWGFFIKLSVNKMDVWNARLIEVLATLAVILIFFYFIKFKIDMTSQGFWFALIAGIIGTVGGLFYFFALKHGKASIVAPLAAMYPLVIIILSAVFLKESISWVNWMAVVLAIISILLFSL